MRILESELAYSIDDIVDAVNEELGFSMIKTSEDKGYFLIDRGIKLEVDFSDEITAELKLPDSTIDLTVSFSTADLIASAIETAESIVEVIRRMTATENGGFEDDDT